ncbi:MAG TPA: HAD hydrolase-like protein [Woeseiaceae bacterium]|nr:HAD hydrolase-like protein [Woeseiaceae bacterium]
MNLFFDLDGTLTDPREGITRCIAHALEKLGRRPPPLASLERYIGPSLFLSFRELLDTGDEERVRTAVALYRERYTDTGLYENRVHEGIPAALDGFRRDGHRMLVVTTKPTLFARRVVGHFGLADRFADVVGAHLDGRRSDKAELIGHALASHGLAAGDCVMIGDRRDDMLGAGRTGTRSIGVLWGFGSAAELRDAGAGALCERPAQLPAAVAALGGGEKRG